MVITENINLNAVLQITDTEGITKPVLVINSNNLVQGGSNFNLNFTIMDKENLSSNICDIQTQMDEFMATLKTKMIELDYKITL